MRRCLSLFYPSQNCFNIESLFLLSPRSVVYCPLPAESDFMPEDLGQIPLIALFWPFNLVSFDGRADNLPCMIQSASKGRECGVLLGVFLLPCVMVAPLPPPHFYMFRSILLQFFFSKLIGVMADYSYWRFQAILSSSSKQRFFQDGVTETRFAN